MDSHNLWTVIRNTDSSRVSDNLKTLLFSGNGYLGVQTPSIFSNEPEGTFINGFFDTAPITYGEKAYGYPAEQQVMVPVADVQGWDIYKTIPGGEIPLTFKTGRIELDMSTGIRRQIVELSDENGGILSCRIETLASMTNPHRLYLRSTFEGEGEYRLVRTISRPYPGAEESNDPRKMESLGRDHFSESTLNFITPGRGKTGILLEETTFGSGLSYCCAAAFCEDTDIKWTDRWARNSTTSAETRIDLKNRNSVELTLACIFKTTIEEKKSGLTAATEGELKNALKEGWTAAAEKQISHLAEIWEAADIRIGGKPEYTRALRYNTFGLLQSVAADPKRNGSAKGLSSGGYNGHYFWDSDIYVQGALNNIAPDRARSLVEYRISRLPEAVDRAGELSEAGALYPWRTINGRESSAFFPAGTAQFHINADVIWGMKDYIRNTGDASLLLKGGAEMLFQVARFWANFAARVDGKGYCFHCVTGPDEYTALVNNNFYTNLMARESLAWASEIYRNFAASADDSSESTILNAMKEKLGLTDDEAEGWGKIAEEVYLPRMKDSDIFMQDDSFLEKAPWDWENTPSEKRPLLLHYHPLKLYRHRVMKQPDVIVGLLLEREHFSPEEIRDNFDFYDPLTSGDSSLSAAIQAAMGALSHRENEAETHFEKTLFLDLEDRENNTDNGIHLASMGGARMAFLYGFAGFRHPDNPEDTKLSEAGKPLFTPRFPKEWGKVEWCMRFRGKRISLEWVPKRKTGPGELHEISE